MSEHTATQMVGFEMEIFWLKLQSSFDSHTLIFSVSEDQVRA